MKILLKTLVILLLSAGCDSFLDEPPITLTTPELALNTEVDIATALHGAYTYLNDDGYGMMYFVIGDAATDNGKIPSDREASGAGASRIPYAYTLELSEQLTAGSFWTEGYNVIAAVNRIIERLEEVEFSQEFENQVLAECLSLRALMHFSLTQLFAQDYNFSPDQSHLAVPYMLVVEPGSTPKRNTMKEVYDLCLEDVNQAVKLFNPSENYLTDNGLRAGADIYFLNYYSALGLRAKMNFYRGNYSEALTDANELIGGPFQLEEQYTSSVYNNDGEEGEFVDQWYSIAPVLESEAIFQLDLDEDDGDFANRSFIDIYTANNGNAAHAISNDLYSLYDSSDVRRFWYYDEKATPATDLHVFKYPGSLGINADAHHIPVMRLTEFYLMAAECELRTGGTEDRARSLLLPITERANASPIETSGNELLEDIITERRKELAFEGNRLYDLKRLMRGFQRTDCTLTNGNCSVEYGSHLYAWPIPAEERVANPEIVQNKPY